LALESAVKPETPQHHDSADRVTAPRRESARVGNIRAPQTAKLVLACVAILLSFVFPTSAQDNAARTPAPSLTPPASLEKSPDSDGFIQRWLILEPIRTNTSLADKAIKQAIQKEWFPNQLNVLPHDGDKAHVRDAELTWHAIDTIEFNVNLYHFAHQYGAPSSFVLFWAVTIVNSPEELHDVRLAIGSNAASVWWLNGQEVIGIYGDRQTVIDDGVSRRLTLKKGPNILRCAVFNGGGATDFCARFLGPDEKPLTSFTVTLPDAAHSPPR
jgi:hypothetical protein